MSDWNKGFLADDGKPPNREEIMEAENNRLAEQLSGKVSRLKMISLDMKDGVEDDNAYLDGMGSDFFSTTGLLGGTVTRFSKMLDSGRSNRKMMCYVVGFLVALFVVIYFILSRSKT